MCKAHTHAAADSGTIGQSESGLKGRRRDARRFGQVAGGLKGCLKHMGPWSPADLTLGIRHVAKLHEAGDVADVPAGAPLSPQSHGEFFALLRTEIALSAAAYKLPDVAAIAAEPGVPDALEVVHAHVDGAARFKPPFFLAIDHRMEAVRVVVRGTKAGADVLTDLAGQWEAYAGGYAHSGFLRSAEWLLGELSGVLPRTLEAHPGCAATPARRQPKLF